MSTQEIQSLKDAILTAGKELLNHTSTGAAFLPLDEKNYVAVGTLAGIVSVAGKEFSAEQSSTAPATKVGIASLEGLTRYGWTEDTTLGAFDIRPRADGTYYKVSDVERLLASTAVEQAEPFDLHNAIMNIPCKMGRAIAMNGASAQAYKEGHRDARHAAAELALASQAAPAAPEQVQAEPATKACGQCFGKGVIANIREVCDLCAGSGKTEPASVTVKVERGHVWIVKGNQSFMLAYEADEGDDPAEIEWYANQLRTVLSDFTPDVNIARAASFGVDDLVNRFLGWPMPGSLNARIAPNVIRPIGTHLMNADEARAMFTYCLGAAPSTAAPAAERVAIPEGWKLVPVEPTDDMIVAFAETWFSKVRPIDDCGMEDCYAALIAAAPAAPIAAAQVQEEPDYELIQGDVLVAGTSGKSAFDEILRYAVQYVEDGPLELYKVVRTKIDIPGTTKTAASTEQKGGAA